MIKKLRNQPYAPMWEQEEEEKSLYLYLYLCVSYPTIWHRFHIVIVDRNEND
jgi:hypothetical protein